MRPVLALLFLFGVGCGQPATDGLPHFAWFEYGGTAVVEAPAPGTFRNPILPGFHPDPSVVRVDDTYWLVNSSFAWFPGIPVYRSNDLVNWSLAGHVFDRPGQLDLDSLRVSEGVFAPTLRHHDGTFYVVVTLVGAGGNVVVTATDPAGPWSDPVPLPSVEGIDPDLFFDEDGRAWIAHNGPPPGEPEWDGHRALWIQEFDPDSLRMIGPRTLLVDGGVDPATKPVWIEGPHLFRNRGQLYLIAAEGGTAEGHSQVVFRGSSPTGPFTPWDGNPILTQRDLPSGRPNPVTSTGHADFVQTPAGDWWAVFLGCRPYDDDGLAYHTGRETFLLPVDWSGEWPVILPAGEPVPLVAAAPDSATQRARGPYFDSFDGRLLDPSWVGLRTAPAPPYRLERGDLVLSLRPDDLAGRGSPALVARRQEDASFSAATELHFVPRRSGDQAGLVAMQQDDSWFFLSLTRTGDSTEVRLERRWQGDTRIVARAPVTDSRIRLRMEGDGGVATFSYGDGDGSWTVLAADVDVSILSTRKAGGFTGTLLGLHARAGND